MAIGSGWADGSWVDGAWVVGSWAATATAENQPGWFGDTWFLTPTFGDTFFGVVPDNLLATDIESRSEVSVPAFGQIHVLLATDIESASEVTAPVFVDVPPPPGTDALLATDIESKSEVSVPAFAQIHALLATDIESATELTRPSFSDGTIQANKMSPAMRFYKMGLGGSVGQSFQWQTGSIYSGTKDTTTAWLAEKLATGVNMVKIEDMTAGIYIGFTSDPLVEPTTWSDPYVVTTYIRTTDDYVAWKGSGTGTFKLTQSVAR